MLGHIRQMPNFFVLGARRGGTASLAHYLKQHPAIGFVEPRDPAFFEHDELYELGIDFYQRTFCQNRGDRRWWGEASPSYFAFPHLIGPRLHSFYGDNPLKFVVLLREPVSRAWSHYLCRVQHGYEKRDFPAALAQEGNEAPESSARYFAEGRYVQLLNEWQAYYPLESFLLLLSEDLDANPLGQVRQIMMWLGEDTTMPVNVNDRLNVAQYSRNPKMVEFLNHPPAWLSSLGKRIWTQPWQRHRIRAKLRQRFLVNYNTIPPLDPTIATDLRQRYRNDVLALSKLLGRYLSHWLAEDVKRGPDGSNGSDGRSSLSMSEKIIPRDTRNSIIANNLDHRP